MLICLFLLSIKYFVKKDFFLILFLINPIKKERKLKN